MNNPTEDKSDSSEIIKSQLSNLDTVAKKLINYDINRLQSQITINVMGFALFEGYILFTTILFNNNIAVSDLFDGGESKNANLYTRLKFIRDICSASEYVIRRRTLSRNMHGSPLENQTMLSTKNWISKIRPYVSKADEKTLAELGRLLSDVYDALVRIAELIRDKDFDDPNIKVSPDVLRHILHIRDHFDFAEDYLLDVLRPSDQ